MRLDEFVNKWSKAKLKERSAAQEHFIDLCHLLGHPTPAEADAEGSTFTFEKGARKSAGGDGFADVWKRGFFAWEYKGPKESLEKAYQQLLQYREDLENPPVLIVCDLDRFEVHTNFTNTVTMVHRFTTADLLEDLSKLAILRAAFHEPEKLRPGQTAADLTEDAAGEFACLADMLRGRGIPPQEAAHFLTKVIFCLFAEDVGLLPKRHFSTIVEKTLTRPNEFVRYARELFQAMATGGMSLLEDIAYFNGNLFADDAVLELTPDELTMVRDAGRYDWSNIEPAIFGTLFERSLDPDKRSQIGAHYTHPDDIRAVVEPVLMAPLRREWEAVRQQVQDLADGISTARSKSTALRKYQRLRGALLGFLERLGSVRVLDPACGSGNFLYVSMNLLKDLEKEVILYAGNVRVPRTMERLSLPLYQVTPGQLHGLEVNPYARELAQTAIWIGYIQWHYRNGFLVPRNPILQPIDTIQLRDAILDRTDPDKPKEPDWPDADVIVGNPPFLGGGLLRSRLGKDYVDALFKLYGKRLPNFSDLCCYWHEKARAMIAAGPAKRAGLLATQGIRGGSNRRVLERIKQSGDIFLAYSDRPWVLEGATVHVSIVGFDDGSEQHRMLDGKPASAINANLTAGLDLTKARRLRENLGMAFQGPVKVGPFEIPESLGLEMLECPNPHGRSNADVLRPWVNGWDVTHRWRRMWIIDFGDSISLEDAALYEAPFEYVRQHVRSRRLENRDRQRKTYWWRLGRSGEDLKNAVSKLSRFIVTPRVSKHRVFVWVPGSTLPDSATIAIAHDDDYTFGVLHSRVHEFWARATGTQLRERESGFRYTPTTTFETFPFPWPLGQEPKEDPCVKAIAEAARKLNQLREGWLNPPGAVEADLKQRTLTNLYNSRPTWLALSHESLDRAVLDAYGWPQDIDDETVLANLLALNLAREPAGAGGAPGSSKP